MSRHAALRWCGGAVVRWWTGQGLLQADPTAGLPHRKEIRGSLEDYHRDQIGDGHGFVAVGAGAAAA